MRFATSSYGSGRVAERVAREQTITTGQFYPGSAGKSVQRFRGIGTAHLQRHEIESLVHMIKSLIYDRPRSHLEPSSCQNDAASPSALYNQEEQC
jgi:hypothetical protein